MGENIDGRTDKWINELTDRMPDGEMDRWMGGWMQVFQNNHIANSVKTKMAQSD